MELAIDKKLEHRVRKACRKLLTIWSRLSKREKHELVDRLDDVSYALGKLDTRVQFEVQEPEMSIRDRSKTFNNDRWIEMRRAEINLRVIFSHICPSKQKEARGAYEETMTLLKDIREACKAQIKKDKDNA